MSPHHHHRHHRRRSVPPWHISRRLLLNTKWISSLLWLSGGCWMLLHYFFQQSGEFGAVPNPAEADLIRVHGMLAVAGVFLFGWLTACHVVKAWHQRRSRNSGIAFFAIVLMLVISGYALYYLSGDTLRNLTAAAHEFAGIASCAFAIVHWRRQKKSSSHQRHLDKPGARR